MQGSVKMAGRILLTGALAALAGCGGDIATVESTKYRIKEIRHYLVSPSGVQTQDSRQLFTYLDKVTPDKWVFFNSSGTDASWNTDDDGVAYYSSCVFTGSVKKGAYDLDTELVYALQPLFAGFPAAVSGLSRDDLARSCSFNYNN